MGKRPQKKGTKAQKTVGEKRFGEGGEPLQVCCVVQLPPAREKLSGSKSKGEKKKTSIKKQNKPTMMHP